MKKHILSILSIFLSLAALASSALLYLRPVSDASADSDARIAALEAQNEKLQSRLDSLSSALESSLAAPTLLSWDLDATPLSDGSGARVDFRAEAANLGSGGSLTLSVRLNGKQIRSVPCTEQDGVFTADVTLSAEDGYGYYCILADESGAKQQIALSTPENPVSDIPVYLASSMESYCNFLVDSWYSSDGFLYLSAAYAQAQLPRLSATDGTLTIRSAQLVLSFNGTRYSDLDITLEPDEAEGAYRLSLAGEKLPMPEMQDDEFIDLSLSIVLSDETTLEALGASWFFSEGELYAVMG